MRHTPERHTDAANRTVKDIRRKTHVMLHRYSHSNDQIRMVAVEGLPEPVKQKANTVTRLRS